MNRFSASAGALRPAVKISAVGRFATIPSIFSEYL